MTLISFPGNADAQLWSVPLTLHVLQNHVGDVIEMQILMHQVWEGLRCSISDKSLGCCWPRGKL